ncbi:protein PELPK1 [Kryptolebias marmoratus]|uniref:protein PELPK1 n=1 Tax=Kryptolebias marmoratus TaxID=37003 RepID=UPI0007F8B684|nr:protein PELPK1 [Kryptolebias marmoratus]
MMGKERRKSTTVCLAAAFILTCHLAQTTESLRLTKTERRAARGDLDVGVQEGKIVFGEVVEKKSHVTDRAWEASSNASAEDETSYQADFAGWTQPEMDDAHKEKWNRMATSLHCFGDHLKFRSLGPGASQLEVEQENKRSMPLAMVPPKCGYKMHGNSMAFVMMVPYDGCNMIQQDETYKLPLRWHGNPVSLMCPKRGRKSSHHWPRRHHWPKYPQVPQYPQVPLDPQLPQDPKYPQIPQYPQLPQEPKYPQVPQYPQLPQEPKYPQIPQDPQVPTSPQYPQMPQFPQEPKYPQMPQEPKAPQESQLQYLPYFYSHPLFSYLFSLGPEQANLPQFPKPSYPQQAFSYPTPVTTEPPTTPAPKVTDYPQVPFDPYFLPFGPYVHDLSPYFPYPLPEYPKIPVTEYPKNPTPDVKTTAAPTTTLVTPSTTQSADTQAPSGGPQFYPPENLPFFPYGQKFPHLFYPFQG